ncbi:MAG: hypothetical protein ACYC4L_08360 [Chloroflexota bacterium]
MLTTAAAFARRRLDERAIVGLLFAIALLPLLYELDAHPDYLYNWEEYTVWRLEMARQAPWALLLQSLRLTDGLMTDSGLSPAVLLPALLLSWAGDLGPLRYFNAAFSALAVPLVYLVGKEAYGRRIGLLAASLLATSACFALYARTATNVGISLVPALLTTWLLLRWQKHTNLALSGALGLLFVAEAYYYATIRFLFPLVIIVVVLTMWHKRPTAGPLHVALLCLPLVALLIWQRPASPPVLGSLLAYYNGRGEHIVTLLTDDTAADGLVPGGLTRAPWLPTGLNPNVVTVASLLHKNLGDYINLHLNIQTTPVPLDHWNPRGRLYHPVLTPFFILGLVLALRDARHSGSAVILFLLAGTSLPMLLTNNIHVGRLLITLPYLLLLTARGLFRVLIRLSEGLGLPTQTTAGAIVDRSVAMGVAIVAISWGLLRTQPVQSDVPPWLLAVGLGALLLPVVVRGKAGFTLGAAGVLLVMAPAGIQEWAVPLPVHHPYVLAQALRALPDASTTILFSHRSSGQLVEMEAACLQFYLRERFAVRLGAPAASPSPPAQRTVHVVAGDARGIASLPSAMPPGTTLLADRAVSTASQEVLRRQFGDQIRLVP